LRTGSSSPSSGGSADGAGARGAGWALAALGWILGVTAAWWALALWPLGSDAPEWWVTVRAVCFGATPDGLPDAAGWIALVVQPLVLFGVLLVGWGDAVRAGLRRLWRAPAGRALAALVLGTLLLGAAAAGRRVATAARATPEAWAEDPTVVPARLDRPAPPLRLVNQHGDEMDLADHRGRVVLVTFAYAHCTTVCPLAVRAALDAQSLAADAGARPAVWIVSLDPWRDLPSRLPHIARSWALGPDAFVLSGPPESVEAALDAWGIPRARDPRTGEVTHPAIVYVVDRDGRLAYAARPHAPLLARLAGEL
jgi:protein SCO1/2